MLPVSSATSFFNNKLHHAIVLTPHSNIACSPATFHIVHFTIKHNTTVPVPTNITIPVPNKPSLRTIQHHCTKTAIDTMQFGAGTQQCPGQDFHVAVSTKFIAMLVPYLNMDLAHEHFCTVPNDISFNELKGRFVAKVSLPCATNYKPATTSSGSIRRPATRRGKTR